MSEEQIAIKLKAQLPPGPAPLISAPEEISTDEQSSLVSDAVSELELIKLSGELGVIRPDSDTTERLKFIYDQLSAFNTKGSYEGLINILNDYLVRLGFKFREDRFMRLYLWLKMNQEKQALESEMAVL